MQGTSGTIESTLAVRLNNAAYQLEELAREVFRLKLSVVCASSDVALLQIRGFETRVLRDACEHLWADLFFVVESEHYVRITRS